ncbi:protoglobin domain-containing protein [Neisseria sp. Ec49-e6-T10]|uniref:protoglobin domain-containing protein n=1 Tax=Neisseria sp. Ec49-e6-T10 TaxID=3140744 RepID=UPI003EBBCCDE
MSLPESRKTNPELDTFLRVSCFTEEEAARLARLGTIIKPQLPALTDRFYEQLQKDATMQPYLEGRIDALKSTHLAWLESLFTGNYDDAFIAQQEKIGFVHVKVKVPPLFVASSMSFLRAEIPTILTDEHLNSLGESRAICTGSILRVLDLSQFLIDGAYFKSIMDVMGISKALLDRLMTL